jgi:hypothetical protein
VGKPAHRQHHHPTPLSLSSNSLTHTHTHNLLIRYPSCIFHLRTRVALPYERKTSTQQPELASFVISIKDYIPGFAFGLLYGPRPIFLSLVIPRLAINEVITLTCELCGCRRLHRIHNPLFLVFNIFYREATDLGCLPCAVRGADCGDGVRCVWDNEVLC